MTKEIQNKGMKTFSKKEYIEYLYKEIVEKYSDTLVKFRFGTKKLIIIDSRNDLPLETFVIPYKSEFLEYVKKKHSHIST